MNWIYRFERKYGRKFGLSNLMLYVVATQVAVWLLVTIQPMIFYYLYFDRHFILSGQIWRIVTFLFIPLDFEPLRLALYLLFFYMFSRTVEGRWGSCLFTLYYLLGWIGAVIGGFISGYTTNYYLNLSIILAFICLFPEDYINIYFVIPVKAKWLGILYVMLIAYGLWNGTMADRLALLFSLINAIIFFGPDIWKKARNNAKYAKSRNEYRKNWGQDNNPWR